MPQLAGPKHELGVLEAGDQLLARRWLHRLPDLAGRLALDAGQVAERHPHRRADGRLGEVRAQRRLEVDAPCVDELHDQDGGEGLRDRADAVDVVARRGACGRDVGDAEHALPDHLAVTEDACRDARASAAPPARSRGAGRARSRATQARAWAASSAAGTSSSARSMSSSSRSRCVTARMCVGP